MPETPDFDAIACDVITLVHAAAPQGTALVVEILYDIWNARGAARSRAAGRALRRGTADIVAARAPKLGPLMPEISDVEHVVCRRCHGERWICEAHPDRPWPHDACAGPGEPCPVCNHASPSDMGPGWRSLIDA